MADHVLTTLARAGETLDRWREEAVAGDGRAADEGVVVRLMPADVPCRPRRRSRPMVVGAAAAAASVVAALAAWLLVPPRSNDSQPVATGTAIAALVPGGEWAELHLDAYDTSEWIFSQSEPVAVFAPSDGPPRAGRTITVALTQPGGTAEERYPGDEPVHAGPGIELWSPDHDEVDGHQTFEVWVPAAPGPIAVFFVGDSFSGEAGVLLDAARHIDPSMPLASQQLGSEWSLVTTGLADGGDRATRVYAETPGGLAIVETFSGVDDDVVWLVGEGCCASEIVVRGRDALLAPNGRVTWVESPGTVVSVVLAPHELGEPAPDPERVVDLAESLVPLDEAAWRQVLDESLAHRIATEIPLDANELLHGLTASGYPFTLYDSGGGSMCWEITRGIAATGCEHPAFLPGGELASTPRFAMEGADGPVHFVYGLLPDGAETTEVTFVLDGETTTIEAQVGDGAWAASVPVDAQPTLVDHLDAAGAVVESHTEVRNPYQP